MKGLFGFKGSSSSSSTSPVCIDNLPVLWAVSLAANRLQKGAYPEFEFISQKKNSAPNITYLHGKGVAAKGEVYIQSKSPAGFLPLNSNEASRVQDVEKFIVISLVTGSITKEKGLDLASCGLVEEEGGCWMHRHTIDSQSWRGIANPHEFREVLVIAVRDARKQGLKVSWEQIQAELKKVQGLHQQILNLTKEQEQAAAEKGNENHLFRVITKNDKTVQQIASKDEIKKLSSSSLLDQATGSVPLSNPEAQATFNQVIINISAHISLVGPYFVLEEQIKDLARNSRQNKTIEEHTNEELIEEYCSNATLKVKLQNNTQQDFVLWCKAKGLTIKGTDPIRAAYEQGRLIGNNNALVYAIDKKLLIGKSEAINWFLENYFFRSKINDKDAIIWLVENRPEIKVKNPNIRNDAGRDLISEVWSRKIDVWPLVGTKSNIIDWLAASSGILKWQGKDKFAWIIEKWLSDPTVLIQGSSPIIWCINNHMAIEGISATRWLKAREPGSKIFPALINANLKDSENERLGFNEIVDVEDEKGNPKTNTAPRWVSEDSIVWMIKNLAPTASDEVIGILQEVVRKREEAQVSIVAKSSSEDSERKTHVHWLKENRGFDLFDHLLSDKDKTIDGMSFEAWLAYRIKSLEKDKDSHKHKLELAKNKVELQIQLTQLESSYANADKLYNLALAKEKYLKDMAAKYKMFWGEEGLKALADGKEKEAELAKDMSKYGFYLCTGEKDFWYSISSLQITEEDLINRLIKDIETHAIADRPTSAIFEVYGYNVDGKRVVDRKTNTTFTPLQWGVSNMTIARLLLERFGANPNVKFEDGATPIHNIASVGTLGLLQYFVRQGADLTAVDNNGNNVLHVAVQDHTLRGPGRDHVEIIKWIVGKNLQFPTYQASSFFGSNKPILCDALLAKNKSGQNAIDIAVEKGHVDILNVFREFIQKNINYSITLFVQALYQQVNSDSYMLCATLTVDPTLVIGLAKDCTTCLENYLPHMMSSFFYCGVKAYRILKEHDKDFPSGEVNGSLGYSVGGAEAAAGAAVNRVFQIIKSHGVLGINQIPANYLLSNQPSSSASIDADEIDEKNEALYSSSVLPSTIDAGRSSLTSTTLSSGFSDFEEKKSGYVSNHLDFDLSEQEQITNVELVSNHTTTFTSTKDAEILLMPKQEVIEKHKRCAQDFYNALFGQVKSNPKDPEVTAQKLHEQYKVRLSKIGIQDIHQEMENYTQDLFKELIKQIKRDVNIKVDKINYSKLVSYEELFRIHELLTAVQILYTKGFGKDKELASFGWTNKLMAEREKYKDRESIMSRVTIGIKNLFTSSSSTVAPVNSGNEDSRSSSSQNALIDNPKRFISPLEPVDGYIR